jgi:hypothetical protein
VIVAAGAAVGRADPFLPNDPYYDPPTDEWYGPVLCLPEAWHYSLGDPSPGQARVTVAVLDTGVMADTPDLAGRLLAPLSTTGSLPLDGTANHHGTWVASVLAMGVNNGLGGAGVGNFNILPINVTRADGANFGTWVADGVCLAADQGAKVINVSQSVSDYGALNDAAIYARSKGALVFVAAGNSNDERPVADWSHLVFVSGTDALDQRWDDGSKGSSWGAYVDLAAPADEIFVADPTVLGGYGTHPGGTSFAAPLASGAAALLWTINPGLAPEDVLDLLYETAVDLGDPGKDPFFGWGRIDIGAAAARAAAPEPATLALVLFGFGVAVAVGRRRPPRGVR